MQDAAAVFSPAAVARCDAEGHTWEWRRTWADIGHTQCSRCGLTRDIGLQPAALPASEPARPTAPASVEGRPAGRPRGQNRQRDLQIAELVRQGKPRKDVAAMFGLDPSRVSQILGAMARGAVVLLLTTLAMAQVVHVTNATGSPWRGWVRATVDQLPEPTSGQWADGARWALGRPVGLDTHVVDVHCSLRPGEARSYDLARSEPTPWRRPPIEGPDTFGMPTVAGAPLQLVSVLPDGAGYLVHLRGRVGSMLHVDGWWVHYPDQPGFARGEVIACASNPTVPDMVATVPPDFAVRWGDAVAVLPGTTAATLLPAGENVADGQARSWPVVLVWPRLLKGDEWAAAGAATQLGVVAHGIRRLYPTGNPEFAGDPVAWSRQHLPGAIARLHGWEAGPLGVTAASGQTGAQEDQVWVGGECAQGASSAGAVLTRYLVALGQSRRPCHHLEADGAPIEPGAHPRLVIWSGRVHWHSGVSPDRLGKPRALTSTETRGWSGPDREHWLANTLTVAARLTGSPALQWQLGHQARLFLLAETVDPRLSTSSVDAARSVGWAGILTWHLWHNLEDRNLAGRVMARWRDRVEAVYLRVLTPRTAGIWDVRQDARLLSEVGGGYTAAWMPYQQAVGALGLDLACEASHQPAGRALALAAAKVVVERAYSRGDRWIEWDFVGFAGLDQVPLVEGQGAHRTGWFADAWFPFAVETILRHEPDHRMAREIRAQMSNPKWVLPVR